MSSANRKMKTDTKSAQSDESRRAFLQSSSLLLASGAVTGSLSIAKSAHAFGSDTIRVGLVGCGKRGTEAAVQALSTSGGDVRLSAMGDVFEDRMQTALRTLRGRHRDKVDVTPETRFIGFDAYQRVMDSDVDVVILATPPGFRPQHFESAVASGKHVFMEKPVATDAPGVRRVLAAGEHAKKQGLGVQVGLQRQHELRYRECIEQIHNGIIGDILLARVYWNGTSMPARPRQTNDTELKYQCRNWFNFNWLGGDHIDEQHIHNLDVINWVMRGYPVEAQGQGGRQVRVGSDTGQVFDHHFVEYTYDRGAKMFSQCRHIEGCWRSVSEYVHGTKGYAVINKGEIYDHRHNQIWKSEAREIKGRGWQQEQNNFYAALRAGDLPCETENGAKSTMTAILGRMATYGGKRVTWEDAIRSDIELANTASLRTWNDPAPLMPRKDGTYPIAVPGRSRVV